jgi:hypothetical protein
MTISLRDYYLILRMSPKWRPRRTTRKDAPQKLHTSAAIAAARRASEAPGASGGLGCAPPRVLPGALLLIFGGTEARAGTGALPRVRPGWANGSEEEPEGEGLPKQLPMTFGWGEEEGAGEGETGREGKGDSEGEM